MTTGAVATVTMETGFTPQGQAGYEHLHDREGYEKLKTSAASSIKSNVYSEIPDDGYLVPQSPYDNVLEEPADPKPQPPPCPYVDIM